MTTAAPSTALATIQPAFTDPERLALAGYLAGYRGLTRDAYDLDLRQFATWCRARRMGLFAVRRAGIESFAHDLEARGRARATVTRRLCTIAGFYKYAVEEELLEHSPAAHVRRPRVDYESHAIALDRNELGALLVAAGLGPPTEHALISVLALNGLWVSEATGADIEHLGVERGHRTLTITRKGGKVVTIPLAPRTARAIDFGYRGTSGGAGVPGRGRAAAGPARRRAGRPQGRAPATATSICTRFGGRSTRSRSSALAAHPAIAEIAIVARKHEVYGETVVAVVNPLPGQAISLEELRDFGADRLSGYKLPRELILRDLPRTPSGKVLKHMLRADLEKDPQK